MESRNVADLDVIRLISSLAWAIKRNLLLIIVLTGVGILVGLGFSLMVKKQYESRMLLSSEVLPYPNLEGILGTIDDLLKERNYEELKKRLKLDSSILASVNSLETKLLIENENNEANGIEYVSVRIRTFDTKALAPFQKALINYLHSNDYVKARVQQNRDFYVTLIKEVNKEIQSLEELKKNISSGAFFEVAKGNIIFDPTTVNSKILDLAKTKIEYENKLKVVESIHVIEGFAPYKKPVTGRKLQSTFLGGLSGLMLAATIIAMQSLATWVRNNQPR